MKPEIKLFFDFKFTSISPDAQPISLGIVSSLRERVEPIGGISGYESKMIEVEPSKSFYAEFSDFEINRCDDWVKENIVNKLHLDKGDVIRESNIWESKSTFSFIGDVLKAWLSQFSDYNIQFVCDCGTFDWYWMLQLLAEWDTKEDFCFDMNTHQLKGTFQRHEEELKLFKKAGGREIIHKQFNGPIKIDLNKYSVTASMQNSSNIFIVNKTGLPKLPSNISSVPEDLNDLIAIKKGISVREAFDLNREELVDEGGILKLFQQLYDAQDKLEESYPEIREGWENIPPTNSNRKHFALHDAKVIKAIYEKLK